MHIIKKEKGFSFILSYFVYFYAFESNKMIQSGFNLSIANLKKWEGGGGQRTQIQLPIIKVHKMDLLFRNIITSIVHDHYYSITAEIH